MTENTIRCTNCGLEFESDYDLEQNLIDPETGEIHDGCPTCKTDAYLMDLVKYPDLEPANAVSLVTEQRLPSNISSMR